MSRRPVSLYDHETGEVLDGQIGLYRRTTKNAFQRWNAVNAEADMMLARNDPGNGLPPLNLTDFRVYHALRAHMETGNLVRLPQMTIANRIGMAPSNFSAAVNRLCRMGIVEKGDKIGRSFPLRISPIHAWNGKGPEHQAEARGYAAGVRKMFKLLDGGK